MISNTGRNCPGMWVRSPGAAIKVGCWGKQTATGTHDIWVGEVPFEPWIEGAGGSFQWEVPILADLGEVVVKIEEVLVGVEAQVYSTEVGGD